MTSAALVPQPTFHGRKPLKWGNWGETALIQKPKVPSVSRAPTCILSPLEDGGDFVALGAVTLGAHGGGAHSHRALVGLDPAQEGGGRAGAVGHLSVGVVCLHTRRRAADVSGGRGWRWTGVKLWPAGQIWPTV